MPKKITDQRKKIDLNGKAASQNSRYTALLVGHGRERCYFIISQFHLILNTICQAGNFGALPRKRRKQASKIKLNSSRGEKCSNQSVSLHKFLDYFPAKATLLYYISKLTCFCNEVEKVTQEIVCCNALNTVKNQGSVQTFTMFSSSPSLFPSPDFHHSKLTNKLIGLK